MGVVCGCWVVVVVGCDMGGFDVVGVLVGVCGWLIWIVILVLFDLD